MAFLVQCVGVFYVKHKSVKENYEENSGSGIPFLAGDGYQKWLEVPDLDSVNTGIVL